MLGFGVAKSGKLPVLANVRRAYATVLNNFGELLRISCLPLIAIAAITGIARYSIPRELIEGPTDSSLVMSSYQLTQLIEFLKLPFLSMIAVSWHRFVLRNEQLKSVSFPLDLEVWKYLKWAAAFAMFGHAILTTSWLAIDFTWTLGGTSRVIGILIMLALTAAAIFVLFRVSPMLPGLAIAERVSLSQTWRATRGNFWRLFLAEVLLVMPIAIILAAVVNTFSYFFSDTEFWRYMLSQIVMDALTVVFGVISVGFLSLAYRHFFPARLAGLKQSET